VGNRPGRLLASGRDGDIYEFGPGRVLRRAKDGRSIETEARAMEYARAHGYPVPEVYEVRGDGSEIVMERVDGPLMLDTLGRNLLRLPRWVDILRDLHDRLHEIVAPDWLPQLPDGGDRLLHLDLHPLNVIMSARGPVVIDWTGTARGEPMTDVALTYVLLTCPRIPAPRPVRLALQPFRGIVARTFARGFERAAFDERLAEVAEMKALDRNMYPDEIAACLRLAARARKRTRREQRKRGQG
jgi:aminoglycoside phosphotransferase (APT) family kinase protein